jgi:TonB family protein
MTSNRHALWISLLAGTSMSTGARELPALIDVHVSEERITDTGKWRYETRGSAQPWACNDAPSSPMCTEHVVVLANESPQTLECSLHVDFNRADGSHESSFDGPALVLPRTKPVVHSLVTDAGTRAEVTRVSCHARAAYKRVPKVEGCKYEMLGKPFETYYPAEARRLGLSGPVIVSFLLDRREGAAKDLRVAESSLVPSLDEAARRFMRDQVFLTNCPDTRFDVLMRFKLRD